MNPVAPESGWHTVKIANHLKGAIFPAGEISIDWTLIGPQTN
jgi:hypothetical protein